MKSSSERAYALAAKVEVAKVRFEKGADLGIQFTNQIDAWSKMQFKFRSSNRVQGKYVKSDLSPLIYAVRERLD